MEAIDDPSQLTTLRLVGLCRSQEADEYVVATFELLPGARRIKVRATVNDLGGIRGGSFEPDPFVFFSGSAEEVRAVVRALVAFWDVSGAHLGVLPR